MNYFLKLLLPSIQQNLFDNSQKCPLYNLEEELYNFAAKTGGRGGSILSCPKKPPHHSFQEWYHAKAHRKFDVICSDGGGWHDVDQKWGVLYEVSYKASQMICFRTQCDQNKTFETPRTIFFARPRTKHLKWIVLEHSVIKTKHLRREA
jgi:hypothetical protein